MDDTFQTTFSNVFSLMRIADFFKNIIEICSQGSNQQYSNIGSENDLAPVRRQAIFWIYTSLVYWRIFASVNHE